MVCCTEIMFHKWVKNTKILTRSNPEEKLQKLSYVFSSANCKDANLQFISFAMLALYRKHKSTSEKVLPFLISFTTQIILCLTGQVYQSKKAEIIHAQSYLSNLGPHPSTEFEFCMVEANIPLCCIICSLQPIICSLFRNKFHCIE